MMNIIDNNETKINLSTFADQPLSSVFDCNNNIESSLDMNNTNNMNNNMNNMNSMDQLMNSGMNSGMNNANNLGSCSQDKNKLLLKSLRNKNSKDFKELVSNFWMPAQKNDGFQQPQTLPNQALKALKSSMSNNSISRRTPSTDAFGNFHPIELSSNKNNNLMNGKPNATMDMRIPLESTSSSIPLFSADNLGINKNFFRPSSSTRKFSNSAGMVPSSNGMDNTMMPPITQSMTHFNNSRRVSMCSSSVVSDDSHHSRLAVKPSPAAIINAATNIVNGNDFEGLYNMNNNINVDHTTGSHNHMDGSLGNNGGNVVSEPGPYDIVCGRNSGAYNYIGNRRFRVTIEMNLQRYIDSPTREDKTNVIKSIVWMLHEQVGARFLKKETCKKSSGSRRRGTPRYTIMTDKQAREKVGHALRDLVITARKEQLQEKKQPREQVSKEILQQC
jgi:hypothetical protein